MTATGIDRPVRALDLDVDAEVGHVQSVAAHQVASIDNVLLGDANQHVLERNELGGILELDLLQVVPEPGFCRAPVGDGVAIGLIGGLELRLVPVHLDRGVPLEVERLLVRLAEPRVEHELGSPTGVTTRCACVSAMSSATPCSGWHVVKHWRNEVPRY